jgi:hypothetical protein
MMFAPSSWLPAASEDAMIHNLRTHFESLMLPVDAAEWLLMLWQSIQTFDDYADDDFVKREALDATIWNVLVAMPQNTFFARHVTELVPLVGMMVLKWQASDRVEREGGATAQSYVWRAGYYELVLAAVRLCHGPAAATSVAHKVLGIYGEKLDDYLTEFKKEGAGNA